ncbi:ArsR/SmtB family transcription factor [Halorientalis litorea]|jgi:ArsR family transcriptional regulator|uniref:ArsR/SmtB family transcription factor n=1 Tax=Halorientalis litorea TaxID=2931977 RepID=UPI001FF5AE2E|nr:metalloregulator ArsR/SmtB family transcription factor [Halorientalis litorea]
MSETGRLRNLLAEQLGECCDADVQERLDSLAALDEAVDGPRSADLAALKTLGDETRHRVVRLLVAADRDLCVCELDPLLDVSESAVSHALSDLADAGLVTRRKEGTWHYYRPTDRATDLVAALDGTRGNR